MTERIARYVRALSALAILVAVVSPLPCAAQGGEQAEKDFAFAEGLYGQENYELALTKYEAFIQANPNHANMSLALFRAGECNFRLNKFAEAAPWFQQVVERFATSEEAEAAWLWLGDARYKSANYEGAAEAYESLLRNHPNSTMATQAAYWRAESYYHLGRYEEAIAAYQDALNRKLSDHEVPYALYSIGLANLQLKRYDEAARSFAQVTEKYPESPVVAECLYLTGSAYHSLGKMPQATEAYKKVLAEHADSAFAAWAQSGLAGTQFKQQQYEDALAGYTKVVTDWAGSAAADEAQLRVGDSLFYLQRWPEAALAYAKAAEKPESKWVAEALYWLGVTCEMTGEADKALAAYVRLTTEHAESARAADAWAHMGMLKAAAGDHDGATAAYQAAVAAAQDPARKQEIQAALAWEQYQRDGSEMALAELEKAVRDNPTSEMGQQLAWRVANAHLDGERWQQALDMLGIVLAGDPAGARADEARYMAANCQDQLGNAAEAEKLYGEIIAGGRGGEWAVYAGASLTSIYAGRGELDQAQKMLADLQTAGAEGETMAFACYTVAEALRNGDRPAEALVLYEKALAASPDGSTAPYAWLGTGWARLATQDPTAAAAFEETLKRFANSDAAPIALQGMLAAGQDLFAREQYDAAAAAYTRIIDGFPESTVVDEARYGLAWVKLRQDKEDEAMPLFEAAATAADDAAVEIDARYQAARLLAAGKEYARAAALLEPLRGREADGDRLAWAMVLLGQAWTALDQAEPAVGVFGEVLTKWPEHEAATHARLGKGRALRLLKRYDDALVELNQATGSSAEQVAIEAQYELAATMQDKGDVAQAAEEFLKVAILHSNPTWAAQGQFAAGACYEQLGEREKAVKSYQVIVNRYAGETEWVARANERIAALGQ